VEFPEPAIAPGGPSQQLASLLLELHGDEWLPIVALHYRWNLEENTAFATAEFGRYGFPWLPGPLARRLAAPMAKKMAGYLPLVGVHPETIPGVESFTKDLIAQLDNHFCRHSYLLGERPCLGDFALLGPLWAHLYRDPESRALFDGADSVVAWMQRLLEPSDEWGSFLLEDEVPTTLDPIFKTLFGEQFIFVRDLVAAINSYCDEHPEATRVPRSLGDHDFVIGGHSGRRRLITFSQWMAQRPLERYQGFSAEQRSQADLWLTRVGGLEAMQLQVRHPFERRNFKMQLRHRNEAP
jgi:glutathione S-transferase